MKKFLTDLIERKKTQAAELRKKIEGATDINEARADYATLEALNKEISDAMEQLKKLDEEGEGDGAGAGAQGAGEGRAAQPAGAPVGTLNPLASYGIRGATFPLWNTERRLWISYSAAQRLTSL